MMITLEFAAKRRYLNWLYRDRKDRWRGGLEWVDGRWLVEITFLPNFSNQRGFWTDEDVLSLWRDDRELRRRVAGQAIAYFGVDEASTMSFEVS